MAAARRRKKKAKNLKKKIGESKIIQAPSTYLTSNVCADDCIGDISDHLFHHQNIYIFFKSPQKAKEITNALCGLKLSGFQNQSYMILMLAQGAPDSWLARWIYKFGLW